MDKYIPNDILHLIYDFIPYKYKIKTSNVCLIFNNRYMIDIKKIKCIQKIYKKNRLSHQYLFNADINCYNHYQYDLDYNDWNIIKLYRYYIIHYPFNLINLYTKSILRMYQNGYNGNSNNRREKIQQWINNNNNRKKNRRYLKDFFLDNNITTKEIFDAGW
jgi:hypothetical protein